MKACAYYKEMQQLHQRIPESAKTNAANGLTMNDQPSTRRDPQFEEMFGY